MRTVVIFNPSAGGGHRDAAAAAVGRALEKRGLDVQMQATRGPGDATAIARGSASEADVIVAMGGDGTINEVINGMLPADRPLSVADPGPFAVDAGPVVAGAGTATAGLRRCALGIVPAGTVNVLALELGIPRRVDRACDIVAAGRTRSLDVGTVNDRRFVLMAGAGIDALTVRSIDPRTKKLLRELAFLGTGIAKGLADRPPPFLVRADGKEYTATFLVAGNSRYYAHHLSLTPTADPTDGLLDLMIFTGTTRSGLATFWLGTPSGLHLTNPHVISLRTRKAELMPLDEREPIWLQTDGELAGRLPAMVTVEPAALEVLTP